MAKKQIHDPLKDRKKDRKAKGDPVMSSAAFKRWRKSLKLSQKEAAQALGIKRRALQYYEKGERDGDPVEIPKAVRLACFALAQGCEDYTGPEDAPHSDEASDAAGLPPRKEKNRAA